MTTLAINPKKSTSIKLPLDTKQALERFAEQENRSVHYLLVTAVEEFVTRKQEEADYQEQIKNRVMKVYERVEQNGSRGEPSKKVFSRLRQEMKAYAEEQGK